MNNPYESFQHSLVASKIWLCEEIEKVIDNRVIKNPSVNIFGSWHNLLSFMMIIRRPEFYGVFNAYDKDDESIAVANQICDTWKYQYPRVYNHAKNVNELNFSHTGEESIFINCSVDQFEDTSWINSIPKNRLVCLQCTNMPIDNPYWEVKQTTNDSYELAEKYKLHPTYYMGERLIQYDHITFKRYMVIGYTS